MSAVNAAAYLDKTTRTLRNYVARGHLPAYRIRGSRSLMFKRSDLDALLEPVPTTGQSA